MEALLTTWFCSSQPQETLYSYGTRYDCIILLFKSPSVGASAGSLQIELKGTCRQDRHVWTQLPWQPPWSLSCLQLDKPVPALAMDSRPARNASGGQGSASPQVHFIQQPVSHHHGLGESTPAWAMKEIPYDFLLIYSPPPDPPPLKKNGKDGGEICCWEWDGTENTGTESCVVTKVKTSSNLQSNHKMVPPWVRLLLAQQYLLTYWYHQGFQSRRVYPTPAWRYRNWTRDFPSASELWAVLQHFFKVMRKMTARMVAGISSMAGGAFRQQLNILVEFKTGDPPLGKGCIEYLYAEYSACEQALGKK